MCISKINYSISIIQYFLNLLYTSNCSCIFHKFDSHYNFTKINYLPLPLLVYKQKPFQDYETRISVLFVSNNAHWTATQQLLDFWNSFLSFCFFNYIIVVMTFPQKASKDDATPNQKQGKNCENTCKLDIHCKI